MTGFVLVPITVILLEISDLYIITETERQKPQPHEFPFNHKTV